MLDILSALFCLYIIDERLVTLFIYQINKSLCPVKNWDSLLLWKIIRCIQHSTPEWVRRSIIVIVLYWIFIKKWKRNRNVHCLTIQYLPGLVSHAVWLISSYSGMFYWLSLLKSKVGEKYGRFSIGYNFWLNSMAYLRLVQKIALGLLSWGLAKINQVWTHTYAHICISHLI